MATLSTVYGVAPAFIINPPTMIATNPSPSPTITNSRPRSTPRRPISFSPSSTTKGAASKKVVQAAAAATNAANGSVDAAAVAAGKRRKRGRASELTRKYRPVSDFDESILIGDNDNSSGTNSFFSSIKDNLSTTKTKKNISQDGLINNITNIKKRQIQQQQQQQQQQQKQKQQERQQQRKVQDKRKNIIPCYSRFPSKWDDALSQMCGSTALALARGFDRLKINVENVYPYLYQQQHQLQAQNNNEQIDEITLLTHAACILLRHVIGKDAKHPTIKEVGSFYCTQNQSLQQYSNTNNMEFQSKMDQNSFTPRGAVLLFNSQQDLNNSQNIIKNYLPKNVKVGVLGEVNPTEFIGNIIIVVKPSNRNNNPINIEYVEHVHYSNFHIKNWVIFLNPNLISLSNFQTVHRESKLPLFMGDYLSTFYVEPITFPNYVGNGGSNAGVLRCYPRKWELYMSKNNITSNKFNDINNCGLRLVSEQKIQPSREKIQCEFSWRIQREIEQGPEEQIRVG